MQYKVLNKIQLTDNQYNLFLDTERKSSFNRIEWNILGKKSSFPALLFGYKHSKNQFSDKKVYFEYK